MNMGSHAPATQGSRLCSTNQSLCCASWGMHPDCKTLKTPRSLSRQRNDSVAKSDGEVENDNATIDCIFALYTLHNRQGVAFVFDPCLTSTLQCSHPSIASIAPLSEMDPVAALSFAVQFAMVGKRIIRPGFYRRQIQEGGWSASVFL